MTDLGTFGGAESFGSGINDAGQVVGWAQTSRGFLRAFLYSGGSLMDITRKDYSEANAINNLGQVVDEVQGECVSRLSLSEWKFQLSAGAD